ncbi:hypothetical protein [Mycetocola lacteus]|uniref:hypothetical protein n=1 Tax=Mycetocola lacteus TaxID=76637 RepID=UPI0011C3DB3B|nr:hypothetical protein [Mycetocola lacteus]
MNERNNESPRKSYGRWAEDMGNMISAEPSGRYSHRPSDAVTFARIVQDGITGLELVGFIWFSDAEHAAGYFPADANIPISGNAGRVWSDELNKRCAKGRTPSEAFAALALFDLGNRIGRINVDSVQEASNIEGVRVIAKSAGIDDVA